MSPEDSEQRFAFKPHTPPAPARRWREGGTGGHTKRPYELRLLRPSCRLWRTNGFCASACLLGQSLQQGEPGSMGSAPASMPPL